MFELIQKTVAYEKHDGTPHIFEVYRQNLENAAPFVVMLDGAFFATEEYGVEIAEEIESTIKWYDWSRKTPIFA